MKAIKKILTVIFLMLILLISSANIVTNAQEIENNVEKSLDECLNLIDKFDFYEIRSPEEIRQVGNQFKDISNRFVPREDYNQDLNSLILNAYESLTELHIDMEKVHESFQKIVKYDEDHKEEENIGGAYVYKAEVVEKINEMYGEENNIILGYIDHNDRVNNYITRAELGTIIYRTIDKSLVANELNKKMVLPGLEKHWSKEYLANEYMVSILNLDEKTNLDECVPKEEVLSIAAKLNYSR